VRPYHIRATILPYGDRTRDLWVVHGRITFEPQDGTDELPGTFVLPGLVDCHVHLTFDYGETGLPTGTRELVDENRRLNLLGGTTLLRDIGNISDAAIGLDGSDGLPRVQAANRFLAPPHGYFGAEQPTEAPDLPTAAAAQVRTGSQWVKLVGDWPRGPTDFRNSVVNYTASDIAAAVAAVHGAGGRVAMHCTAHESVARAVEGGVDTVEHGAGIDETQLAQMAAKGIAWTPTLVVERMATGMAASTGDPQAAAYAKELFAGMRAMVSRAHALGVTILAGTDVLRGGEIWREIAALQAAGLSPADALAAATSVAREFLGEPALDDRSPADLVLYAHDPRNDPELLAQPELAMLGGRVVARR